MGLRSADVEPASDQSAAARSLKAAALTLPGLGVVVGLDVEGAGPPTHRAGVATAQDSIHLHLNRVARRGDVV